MHLTQHMDQDVLILAPGRKLTAAEGKEDLSEAVHAALGAGVRKILLDCTSVEFIDSLGVGQIVASFVSAKNQGARLILCGLGSRIMLVLRMANLHLVLDMRETGPEGVTW
jgi:anti-sigma B factor antagonist